jgi:glycosyltransferase involved in cell wall biosynthesis
MSLVALEGGVTGTPVLLTDACGFDEVQEADGGRIVSATTRALADGLTDLLAEPAHLPAMGRRLRDLAVRQYGWPSVVQQYLDLARQLRREQLERSRGRGN